MSNMLSDTMSDIISDIEADALLDSQRGTETHSLPPWMFNLAGTFLGLLGEAPDKVVSIVLAVDVLTGDEQAGKISGNKISGDEISGDEISGHEQEIIAIGLPKKLQAAVKRAIRQRSLKIGDRVRCIGRSQLNYAESVIKLKAYCLFSDASTGSSAISSTAVSSTAVSSVVSSAAAAISESRSPAPTRQQQKILICHKSGCKKRGGRQLVAALEQTLQQYQLQDHVEIQYTGCQKRCSKAPGLTIMPGKHHYDRLSLKSIPTLIEKHFCELPEAAL
ncbi:MAG: (2Fe-2S) ferredoxin domain-containing protein [Phormidesmis sp. RL_2_1]|nr:(2Fe-2S) ferredoxin domain-containing protein [Phormidesmis sp. RL_2_1]